MKLLTSCLIKKKLFEIYIPKSTKLIFSKRESIAIDYLKLAFTGELFGSISDSLNYECISPEIHESVLFKIETSKIEELAEILFQVSLGYVNDIED